MLAIKTLRSNIESEMIIGQIGVTDTVVLETDSIPAYSYEDLTDTDIRFTQRVFDGKFGTEVTYAELVYIRSLLEELGDYGKEAGSLSELELRKEITDIQLAMVEE